MPHGGDFDPWPGVQIHDVVFLCHLPVNPSVNPL